MNVRKKGGDIGRSGLARTKLLGAFGHVHNLFSIDSHKDHDVQGSNQNSDAGDLRGVHLRFEMAKAEAGFMVRNLIARIQKS